MATPTNKTRFDVAKPDIVSYFDERPTTVYRFRDFSNLLDQNRSGWRFTADFTARKLVEFMLKGTKLERKQFKFPSRTETLYTWGNVPTLELVSNIKQQSYFSHYTALHIHGLTDQLPKTIYLSIAQSRPQSRQGGLSQESLNTAFKRRVRTSNNIAEYNDFRITILNPMGKDRLGITDGAPDDDKHFSFTDLERTLIDIVVRPIYSGGVDEVLNAYSRASAAVSINRLAALLHEMDYVYPYHQAIGFYLQKSGQYDDDRIGLLRQSPMEFDFYLTHGMQNTVYVPQWRLFVPEHMKL